MADEATITAEVPEEEPTPTFPPGSKSAAATLHEEVATFLKKDSAGVVRKRVIDTLVEEKLEERKKLVLTALGNLRQQRQEIEVLKRKGHQAFGLDKKPLGSMSYTKKEVEDIEKAVQKSDKLEKALDKALTEGDYTKLAECCKGS